MGEPNDPLPVIRVALASEGGTDVDRHFGRASRFPIYRWDGARWVFEEVRTVPPLCGEDGHGEGLPAAAGRFADCRFVLAVTAGPAVVQQLAQRGVNLMEAEGPIEPLLERLPRSPLYRKVFSRE
jgi:predicted Fe-Mo cluster-binding NifX family protein